jgi:hypothetical protein
LPSALVSDGWNPQQALSLLTLPYDKKACLYNKRQAFSIMKTYLLVIFTARDVKK